MQKGLGEARTLPQREPIENELAISSLFHFRHMTIFPRRRPRWALPPKGETITPSPRSTAAMTTPASLPIAAIVYSPADDIEALLLLAARALAAQGVKVGGVLQHDIESAVDDPCAMELEDLATGERFALSQDLGSCSAACRLDPASLAHAAISVRAAISAGADLLFINKFGGQEAAGAGLRDEMGLAVLAGVPLLTAVGQRFVGQWQEFTGGAGTLLEPRLEHVLDWWAALHAAA